MSTILVAANNVLSAVVTKFRFHLRLTSFYCNDKYILLINALVNMSELVFSLIRNIIQEQQHVTLILNCTTQLYSKGQITVVSWNIMRIIYRHVLRIIGLL